MAYSIAALGIVGRLANQGRAYLTTLVSRITHQCRVSVAHDPRLRRTHPQPVSTPGQTMLRMRALIHELELRIHRGDSTEQVWYELREINRILSQTNAASRTPLPPCAKRKTMNE